MPPPSDLITAFRTIYAHDPAFTVRSPGRTDLIGSHTDYNEGWVLPLAIDRAVWLAARPISDPQITIHALDLDEVCTFALSDLEAKHDIEGEPLPDWAKYAAGVAWSLQEAGYETSGCQIALRGNVPVGAGLSSSAAVEVAYALAWTHLAGNEVDRMSLAQLCRRAENAYVGVNSGLMDQFACLFGRAGHALLFDTRSLAWEAVPLPKEVTLLVADSNTRRTLADSAYNQRQAECEEALTALQTHLPDIKALCDLSSADLEAYHQHIPEPARQRAQHVIRENERVRATADALKQGDIRQVGALMDNSHLSMRDLFEASSPALDTLWRVSHGHPARLGGRILGAGWGRLSDFLAWADTAQDFAAYLRYAYQETIGHPAEVYQVTSADGAQIVSL